MNDLLIGIDIGGTKCAVVLGDKKPEVLERIEFPTAASPDETLEEIFLNVRNFLDGPDGKNVKCIGVSCGGPLNSRTGTILSPPNLPGWDNIEIVNRLKQRFGLPAAIQNDANACALAEWKWGAGKGSSNMIFLTFGTGLGAGLILDGRLYSGTNDMAGEAGHLRLENDGPVGYGKAGSFEGFCSGGGIALQAEELFGRTMSAREVCEAAAAGDAAALGILENSGRHLGMGLSILIDLLNPELIVIGSIFARCGQYLEPAAQAVIRDETLSAARDVCRLVPAALGEQIGDFACLSVALSCEEEVFDNQA
ncbi:MAG: ROK family protein [Spirochaetales bacterium]|uniref:ROK family protein n=1 Tax=Candidatus Thalassospirochaeta sargassi TaxID=3119039 RepID=A0AAJ1MLZ0_9SPIO|nr:ROK family protein [Spirochaetales bacterium]